MRSISVSVAAALLALAPAQAEKPPAPVVCAVDVAGNTRTRERVIRDELLFAPGDTLQAGALEESERNLRRLLFLGQVRIDTSRTPGGVGVRVQVQDLYSRALSPLLAGEPGELSYGLVALDYNLLGRGQTLRLSAQHRAVEGNRADVAYEAPRLGAAHAAAVSAGLGAEDHVFEVTLSHPFRALGTRASWGIWASHERHVERLYARQRLTWRYEESERGLSLWAVGSLGGGDKWRPGLYLSATDRSFAASPPFSGAPSDRRRVLPSAGLMWWRPAFARARFIQSLGPLEDLQTGSWVFLRWGLSRRWVGSDRDFAFWQVQASPRLASGDRTFLFTSFYAGGRTGAPGLHHVLVQAEVLGYRRLGRAHSLAVHLRADALHRPEDDAQLLLGLDSGLRGYPPRRFDGTRRWVAGVEVRPALHQAPDWVLAAALFAEAGVAWTPGTRHRPAAATGAGVRLGLPRVYNTPVLRSDLAYAWTDRALQVSVGVGQYF
ncbi:MAG: POTRA domain-containing protein [Candidatus Latescibacterota bacterium]